MSYSTAGALALLIALAFAGGCVASGWSGCGLADCTVTKPSVHEPRVMELADLALTEKDVPFAVGLEKHEDGAATGSETGVTYGVRRMYAAGYTDGGSLDQSSKILIHTIMEYSPGNASRAYDYLYREATAPSSEAGQVTQPAGTGIGDRSFAFAIPEGYSSYGTARGIVFVRANVLEYIILVDDEAGAPALTAAGRAAAAKVPAGGVVSPVAAAVHPARTADTRVTAPAGDSMGGVVSPVTTTAKTKKTSGGAVTAPQRTSAPASKRTTAVAPGKATNPQGLLVWYDFEDDFASSGVVTDKSGSGRDGVITGTVAPADGVAGTNGIRFSGRGYLLAKDNPAAGRTAVTFSFWFRTRDPTQNYKFASAAEWRGGPGTGWTMATHRPEFWADDGPEDLLVPGQPNTDNAFVPDTWTHEAVVYDGTTMKEYTNGVLINTWEARGVPMSAGVPMAVGGWPQFQGHNYVGEMDDFRIYDRALEAGDIAALSRGT